MSGSSRRTTTVRSQPGKARATSPSAAAPAAQSPGPWDPPEEPFALLDSKKFARSTFLLDWLVKGWLAAGQLAVVGGPPKSMKTFFCVNLAVSLGSGTDLFGQFPVPARKPVLFFSGESGGEKLQRTANQVCTARDVRLKDCEIFWHTEPPDLATADGLRKLHWTIRACKAEVVIIDPAYLSLFGRGGASPANLFEAGRAIMEVNKACRDAGATPILVYHTRKRKAAKDHPVRLSDLAFSGIAEAARQWTLVDHREPYVPGTGLHQLRFQVGGSAGHSGDYFVDVNEGRGEQIGQSLQVRVLTADEVAAEEADAGSEACAGRPGGFERWRHVVADWFVAHPDGETQSGVRKATKCPQELAGEILRALRACGLIEPAKISKPFGHNSRLRDGFRLKQPAAAEPPRGDVSNVAVEPGQPPATVVGPTDNQEPGGAARPAEPAASSNDPAPVPEQGSPPTKRRYSFKAVWHALAAVFGAASDEPHTPPTPERSVPAEGEGPSAVAAPPRRPPRTRVVPEDEGDDP